MDLQLIFAGLVMIILTIAAIVLYCVENKCPRGGLHRWKKTGSESTLGAIAQHQQCRKCGKKCVALPISNVPY